MLHLNCVFWASLWCFVRIAQVEGINIGGVIQDVLGVGDNGGSNGGSYQSDGAAVILQNRNESLGYTATTAADHVQLLQQLLNGSQPLPEGARLLTSPDNTTHALLIPDPTSGVVHITLQTSVNITEQQDKEFVQFLWPAFVYDATASSAALDAFASLTDEAQPTSLLQAISDVWGGDDYASVVCQGEGAGGSLAQICSLWSAVSLSAYQQIVLVTFDAPGVGNAQFNWTVSWLVSNVYFFPFSARDLQMNSGVGNDVRGLLSDTVVNLPVLVDNGSDLSPIRPVYTGARDVGLREILQDIPISSITGSSRSGSGSNAFNPLADEQVQRWNDTDKCPLVLCQIRLAIVLSCDVYGPSDHKEDPEYVPLLKEFPQSRYFADSDSGVNGAVVWLPERQAAAFVFQGAVSQTDWDQVLKFDLSDEFINELPEDVRGVYGDARVHSGLYQQFASVTYAAPQHEDQLDVILDDITGGMQPRQVYCTGHSAGGAASFFCGVWAAVTYPTASVSVINFGAPMIGNQAFAEMFQALVGRSYRVVHQLDIVPALPPFDSYIAVDGGVWLNDSSHLLLDTRPPTDLGPLTWDDHSCVLYGEALLNITSATSPDWLYSQT